MSGKVKAAAIRDSGDESPILAIVNGDGSKSAKIRNLAAMGVERSTIANLMGIRYQHVRNVLVTKLAADKE